MQRVAGMFSRITLILGLVLSGGVTLSPLFAVEGPAPKKVLALYWYGKDFPINADFDRALQTVFQTTGIEYYAEHLESNRFQGEAQVGVFRDYLQRKYSDRKIDLVIGISVAAADFLVKYRNDLFPEASMVLHVASRSQLIERMGGDFAGIVSDNNYARTLEFALRHHPGTKQVFLINGTLEQDKMVEVLLKEQLQEFENKVQISYLTDLPLDELLGRVKNLPERSLIYYSRQDYKGGGRSLSMFDVLTLIANSANVPIYSSGNFAGYGAVGGYGVNSYECGLQAAQMVLRILDGQPPEDIPAVVVPTRPIFDWRQLRRWGIRESSLPSGSEIRFKEPGFFEQYRWRAIAVISLCAVQSLLIALLLVERRRRRRMQIALRERLEFETLFAELSADFTRRPASEIDQGIAKWLQRLGEFFGTGPGDLFELVENGKSAGTSGATGFASGEPYQFTDQFCSGALFSPAANPPGGNLNETEGAPKEAWRKPVLAIPICANGSTWTLTFSATPVQNGWPEDLLPRLRLAGEIFAGAIVRKTSEEALQESQDRYRLATSAGRVVVWDWNIQTSELYADPLLKSLLGYEDHELGNHFDDWFRLIHPEDVEFVLERLRAHVHGGASHFEAEHRFLRKDGSVRWFLASGTAVRNEQGIAVRMVGTDTDITERKLIELELQHLSGRLLDLQDQERQRISRKLHDGTAQSLFAISLNLEYLKKAHGVLPKRFQHALSECRTLCEQCLQEIRTLSYVLHPPMLDGAGLIAALGWYLDGFAKRSGIHVELIAPQDHWRLPEEIEMDLFRIVQECLANVHRHSGSSTAQVRIERAASGVVLRVEDQGRGMQSKTSLLEAEDSLSFGVGLSGIRQRLRHLGGRLEIVSNEQGTTVTAIVPLALAETASDSSPDIGDLEMQGVRREGRRISMRQTEAKSSFNLLSELR